MEILRLYTIIFLLSERCDYVIGVDDFTVQFEGQKTCFEENTHISLVVDYTGSGTPDLLRWKFSKMSNPVDKLNIVTSICIAGAGADPAFPVSRMSYTCDNTIKRYTIHIADFNEISDAGTWEVSILVDGAFTNFKNVTVEKCPASSDSEIKTWQVVLIVCFSAIGLVLFCLICKHREKILDFICELFNCCPYYPSNPTVPWSSNPQPGGGGTIHGNPDDSNRGDRGTDVVHKTPSSENDKKKITTPTKVQPSNEPLEQISKQGRSGLDQSEEKTQRNDPPQDEHRENRRDRRRRFQPRRLPNFMRNFWNSLSRVVCKSASNNTVNAGNDPDKETRL